MWYLIWSVSREEFCSFAGFTHLMTLSREAFDLFSAGSYINWQWNYPNGRRRNQSGPGKLVEDRLGLLLVLGVPIRLFPQPSSGHGHGNISYHGKRNISLKWELVFHAQIWNCIFVLRFWHESKLLPWSPHISFEELEGPKIFYPWLQIILFWESWNAV